jgi:hypothetical protein
MGKFGLAVGAALLLAAAGRAGDAMSLYGPLPPPGSTPHAAAPCDHGACPTCADAPANEPNCLRRFLAWVCYRTSLPCGHKQSTRYQPSLVEYFPCAGTPITHQQACAKAPRAPVVGKIAQRLSHCPHCGAAVHGNTACSACGAPCPDAGDGALITAGPPPGMPVTAPLAPQLPPAGTVPTVSPPAPAGPIQNGPVQTGMASPLITGTIRPVSRMVPAPPPVTTELFPRPPK